MSAERVGWPTHRAKARRAKADRRRHLRQERAARRLAQAQQRPQVAS